MPFTNLVNPDIPITEKEEALLKPVGLDELHRLMDDLEKPHEQEQRPQPTDDGVLHRPLVPEIKVQVPSRETTPQIVVQRAPALTSSATSTKFTPTKTSATETKCTDAKLTKTRSTKAVLPKTIPSKRPHKLVQTPEPKTPRSKRIKPTPSSTPAASSKRTIPMPSSWEEASAEDRLLFRMKEDGGTWEEVTTEWNRITDLEYTISSLSTRWSRIKSKLGTPPDKMDLDASLAAAEELFFAEGQNK